MRGFRLWLLGFIALATMILVACQAILGIKGREELLDSGVIMMPDTGPMMEASTDPCASRGVLPRPPDSTSSPTDSVKIVAALQSLDLGLDAGDGHGFNLDKACTCPGPDTCVRPVMKQACDGVGGIDNGGRALFQFAATNGLVKEKELNQTIQLGISGAFIRLDGYNGQPNDAKVRVSIYSSLGLVGVVDGSAPKFDGTDTWTVDEGSVLFGDTEKPRYYADDGYVVSDTLVVPSLDFPITVGGASSQPAVTLELSDGVIQAKISKNGNITTLDGIIAGRWPAKTLLTGLQVFYDPNDPQKTPFCGSSQAYQLLKAAACGLVDVARNPSLDSMNAPCDAFGIGIHFTALAAKLGPITPRLDAGTPCGPGYTDSCK